MDSIVSTLGGGSGIDTTALVKSLVDAQFSAKNDTLDKRAKTLDAQISGISKIKNAVSDFASALEALTKGGTLQSQPTSSDTGIVKASALSGAKLYGFSGSIEVQQLAAAQTANTGVIADPTAAVGKGTLTLTFGTATVSSGSMTSFTAGSGTPVNITIDDTNSSLNGIASAINAAQAGVTATVLSDSSGARLVLKGKTGADQAFTLKATEDSTAPGLSALDIGPGASGTTIGNVAQDAIVKADGVTLQRSSNSISDLYNGVQLDLVAAKPGTTVSLASAPATDALRNAVNDYVDTYNQLVGMVKQETDPKTGTLSGDSAARNLLDSLSKMTLTNLVNDGSGGPQTLAEIGAATNRDGTLKVDAAQLSDALTNHADAVEKMFSPGLLSTGDGLSAALRSVADRSTSVIYGLGASAARYTKAQSDITAQQDKASADADAMRTRLTQQFASMDAKVAAYKSTQTFLTQQIAAWNSKG
ncbi:flagellar filament capping protein FliD [Stakelama marina]|uniref:flagellar filament capping protein FliD n=1 Tax=Stakelama marina TaxID=2826939 RepID=UPI0024C44F91|nr:flagellar filament capping protein FliD [Stakelama marina]